VPATHGVLFDVGYVLCDEGPRLRAALEWLSGWLASRGTPCSAARLATLYAEACLAPTQPSLFKQITQAAGLPPETASEMRRLLPWDATPLVPLAGAQDALARLKSAGVRTGVLANQPASARADLASAGLLDLLDDVWLSEEVRLAKPDPAFFRLALEAWNFAPGRVAYVGDRPDNDVGPARALGLFAVRLRFGPHAEQPTRGPHEEAHADARSLDEAANRLLAWSRGLGGPDAPRRA
jgi:HAD superfamily hydrolase (TIGR01509 family)